MEVKITSHKDLKVWKESMILVEKIYDLTRTFPDEEKYVLVPQIRRCSISVPSNIAEGFARKGNKELLQFLFIALGSLSELETQIEIASRLRYCKDISEIINHIKFIRVMLSRLITSIKNKPS
ncbi:four helix bundle protein [Chryseobacterium manosquense]|uniref:four helix bundle protein n=1 Tax=Chryseobacterium manosquense TaxID=2754694 RepID=UPI001E33B792|nr:four helix bundle protein [Chryseobacterium manosquense]